jgi:hypothetical protein
MPVNNAPTNLGQDLRDMERRIERLEAKRSQRVDHPSVQVPLMESTSSTINVPTDKTTGTWFPIYIYMMSSKAVDAFQVRLNASHDATTCNLRLQSFDAGYTYNSVTAAIATSDEQAVAGLGGDLSFDWLHGIDISAEVDEWYIELQGEINGIGNLYTNAPYISSVGRSTAATSAGF